MRKPTWWVLALLSIFMTVVPLGAADTKELASGLHLVRGTFTPGRQPDGNSIILEAPEGLVVIDTGRHAAHTEAILRFAREKKSPVFAIINTHWHLDHIAGNTAIREAFPDARIYATRAVLRAPTEFLAGYRTQLQEAIGSASVEQKRELRLEIERIDSTAKLPPDVIVKKTERRVISGRPLTIVLATDSVTAGDLWLVDEQTRTVIAGDLVTLPAPFLDTACPERWRAMLDAIARVDFDLLVPGHGAPMTKKQFTSWSEAFRSLLACSATERQKSDCVDAWLRDVAPLQKDEDEAFARSVTSYYVDLLRSDPSRLNRFCGR